MPRHEQRPIRFSHHAQERLRERGISEAAAEAIVRHGAVEADAAADFLAQGSIDDRWLEIPCLDLGDHILVKTVFIDEPGD